jgi:tape measure domain-containing protein
MQLIARAMGQISTAGKLMGQDMLQLTSAGLPVAQILADAFGVSTAEIIKMREKGLLPAKEVIEALTVYMETNFKGAADNFSTSWAGLMGTFEDLKQMGLREFFTGLFDAVQPLAIAFAEWAQGPGLTLLGTLGDMLGTWAASMVGDLEKLAPVMDTINLAIMQFSNLIDNDWAPLQALHRVLSDLAIVWEGTPLGNLMDTLATFVEDADTEGLGTAFKNLFTTVFSGTDFKGTLQTLADNVAGALGQADWTAVGEKLGGVLGLAIGNTLNGLDTIINGVNWEPVGDALWGAFKGLLAGMFSVGRLQELDTTFANWSVGVGNKIDYFFMHEIDRMFADWSIEAGQKLDRWFATLSTDIGQGFIDGLNGVEMNINKWVYDKIILPVKTFLGIASPSTVFRQIGIDIIQGLINGIDFMLGPLDEIVTGVFDLLTGGNGSSGGTGGTGGASGSVSGIGYQNTGGSTSGVLMGGTVTNIYNFYGTTYVSGAGPAGTYDCAPTISSGGMIPAGVR